MVANVVFSSALILAASRALSRFSKWSFSASLMALRMCISSVGELPSNTDFEFGAGLSAVIASLGFGGRVLCPRAETQKSAVNNTNKRTRSDILLLKRLSTCPV